MFLGGKLCSQNCLSRLPPKIGSQQCQFYLGQRPPFVIGIMSLDFCLTIILLIVAVLAAWGIHMCYNCAMGSHNAEHTETTMIGLFNLSSLNVPSIIITVCVGIAILLIMEGWWWGCSRMMTFCCWNCANPRARMTERLPPNNNDRMKSAATDCHCSITQSIHQCLTLEREAFLGHHQTMSCELWPKSWMSWTMEDYLLPHIILNMC